AVHLESLIAPRDHPLATDRETLCQPRAPPPEAGRGDERLASRVLSRSVLRLGLLPFKAGETEEFEGTDLSGVASGAGEPAPDRVLQWERPGTDEMRAVRTRPATEGGRNRPTLEGRPLEAA